MNRCEICDEKVRDGMSDLTEIFGDVIYSYSRAQAIDDGVLIDVSHDAKQAGLTIPTALTAAAYGAYVTVPPTVECQDEAGRLWDVLWMCRAAIAAHPGRAASEMLFELLVANTRGRARKVTLKAVVGPGDDGSPVITIMKPEED